MLTDSNLLVRCAQPDDPMHETAIRAVTTLEKNRNSLVLVPQVIYEFWSVATRPENLRGGLSLTPNEADQKIQELLLVIRLLSDPPNLYETWLSLVRKYSVRGVNVHDARLVAAMVGLNITHLLTFNTKDFARYTEITVVHPQDIKAFVG